MTALWWARRDLRLHDNPALLKAQEHGNAGAVFAWTPANHLWSGRRRAHLARVLWSLREATGGALAVRRGEAAAVVVAAAREAGADVVYAAKEYTPSGIAAQDAVSNALAADGRSLEFVGSPYAVAPGRVLTGSGTPYRVFTPYRARWRDHGWRAPAEAADPAAFLSLNSDADLDQIAAHADGEDPLVQPHEWREERVLERFGTFIDSDLAQYGEERDRPDLDTTSHLSSALAFGLIHPRTVLAATGTVDGESARTFESEIAWREFHADTLWNEPQGMRTSLTPVAPEAAWRTGSQADSDFMAWRAGRTGFPLVDAGMRQLAQTGWMHNRVRMVAASFLIKDLHLPWQRGADYFRRALVDYDHAQNQLNWQWVAGTGRDAAPFFRIFNPTAQQRTHDPRSGYVQRWVPELDTPEYPAPIVDHREAREEALDMYRARPGLG